MTAASMLDEHYFDVMATQAQGHWWYRARRALVADLLAGEVGPGATVIDVGCGTGDNLGALDDTVARPVVGVELSEYAVRHAPRAPGGGVRVGVARAEHLPFPAGCADLVTSMDVIEHLDDDAALADYHRVVRPGGLVLLTVPAYQWLWSDHDTWAAHRRRYSRRTLVAAVERAEPAGAAGHVLQLVPGAAGRGAAPDPGPPAGQGRAGRGGGGEPGGRPRDERARGRRAALGAAPCRAVRAVDRLPVRSTLSLDFRSRVPCLP